MALELVQAGIQPLGQFDGYDSITTSILGGEVGTLIGVAVTGTDRAAYDANGSDGYVGAPPNHERPAVTNQLASGARPLFLLDDGIAGYGTMFGSVVGGTAGQVLIGGAVLGPHTATGSGKITCWDKPGTYAVTLDAVDTAADGLIPTNAALGVGDPLFATAAGLLTPVNTKSFEDPGVDAPVIARLINFETLKGGTLVNTPTYLVSALNSPTGDPGSPMQLNLQRVVIAFNPPIS